MKNKITRCFHCSLSLLISTIVEAADLSGAYNTSTGVGPSLILTSAKQGKYLVQLSTSDGFGCGGELNGYGKVVGSTIVVSPLDDPSTTCIVSLKLLKGSKIRIEEDSCSGYHGASCDFNGTLSRASSLGTFPELSILRKKHIHDILEDPKIARPLIKILGRKYNVLMDNMLVAPPVTVLEDRYYCAVGNKPHRGGTDEAALCIDQESGRIDIWLLEGGQASYYGPGMSSLPPTINKWKEQEVTW